MPGTRIGDLNGYWAFGLKTLIAAGAPMLLAQLIAWPLWIARVEAHMQDKAKHTDVTDVMERLHRAEMSTSASLNALGMTVVAASEDVKSLRDKIEHLSGDVEKLRNRRQ